MTISFGRDDRGQEAGWTATPVAEHLRRARDSRQTAVVRIEHAARAYMNRIGHTDFDRGELAEILGRDLGAGERKLAGESTVRKAIADAVILGTLAEGSNWRCLIVPTEAGQTQWQKRDSKCGTHRIGVRRAV